MSKSINAVPESITRAAYLELIAAAGFSDLTDLRLLEFRADGIYAEVYVRDGEGRHTVDLQRNEVCCDRVWIPVV